MRRTSALVVAAALVVTAHVATLPGPPVSSTAHVAHAQADPPADRSAVIVGDSLTGGNASLIRARLADAGVGDVRIEGLSARRIAVSFDFQGRRDSGIERTRTLRAAGVDPDVWLIQLGTNDITSIQNCDCDDLVADAGQLIDSLLAELPDAGDETGADAGASIAWVTVSSRERALGTWAFNEALARRAACNPRMSLVDWRAAVVDRPDWFLDDVHPNLAGVDALSALYADAISDLYRQPRVASADTPATAQRIGRPDSLYGSTSSCERS